MCEVTIIITEQLLQYLLHVSQYLLTRLLLAMINQTHAFKYSADILLKQVDLQLHLIAVLYSVTAQFLGVNNGRPLYHILFYKLKNNIIT